MQIKHDRTPWLLRGDVGPAHYCQSQYECCPHGQQGLFQSCGIIDAKTCRELFVPQMQTPKRPVTPARRPSVPFSNFASIGQMSQLAKSLIVRQIAETKPLLVTLYPRMNGKACSRMALAPISKTRKQLNAVKDETKSSAKGLGTPSSKSRTSGNAAVCFRTKKLTQHIASALLQGCVKTTLFGVSPHFTDCIVTNPRLAHSAPCRACIHHENTRRNARTHISLNKRPQENQSQKLIDSHCTQTEGLMRWQM